MNRMHMLAIIALPACHVMRGHVVLAVCHVNCIIMHVSLRVVLY
jgi:hypothetical protein